MATSSITKNFVIRGREQVEAFIDLLEKGPAPISPSKAEVVTDREKIQEIVQAWKDKVQEKRV